MADGRSPDPDYDFGAAEQRGSPRSFRPNLQQADLEESADAVSPGSFKAVRARWGERYLPLAHSLTARYWEAAVKAYSQLPPIESVLETINALAPLSLSVSENGLTLFVSARSVDDPDQFQTFRYCVLTQKLIRLFSTRHLPHCVCEAHLGTTNWIYGCVVTCPDGSATERYALEIYNLDHGSVTVAGFLSVREEDGYQILAFTGPKGITTQEFKFLAPLPMRSLLRDSLHFRDEDWTFTLQIPAPILEIPVPETVRDVLKSATWMVQATLRNDTVGFLCPLDGTTLGKVVCYNLITQQTSTITHWHPLVKGFAISPDARWVALAYDGPVDNRHSSLKVEVYEVETGRLLRTHRIERRAARLKLVNSSSKMTFLSDGSLVVFLSWMGEHLQGMELHGMAHLLPDAEEEPLILPLGLFLMSSHCEIQGKLLVAGRGLQNQGLPRAFTYDPIRRRIQWFYSPLFAARITQSMQAFGGGAWLLGQAAEAGRGSIFRVAERANRLRFKQTAQVPFRKSYVSVLSVTGDSDQAYFPLVDGLRDYVDMFGRELAQSWTARPERQDRFEAPRISPDACAVRSHWYLVPSDMRRRSIIPSPGGEGVLFLTDTQLFSLPQFDLISFKYPLGRGSDRIGYVRRQLDTGLARDRAAADYLNRHWLFSEVTEENTLNLLGGCYLLQPTPGLNAHWSAAPAAGKPAPFDKWKGSWGVILPRYLHHQIARYAQLPSQIERQYLISETYAALQRYLHQMEYWVVADTEVGAAKKIVREFENFARANGFLLEDAKETLLRPGAERDTAKETLLKPAAGPSPSDPEHLLRAAGEPDKEE